MLDHSAIYRSQSILHWHHRARLRQVLNEVSNYRDASSVADIGCSNGYVTNLLSEVCQGSICGYDYLPEMVASARSSYAHIDFRRADLNQVVEWGQSYELVCCFETLEHVGDISTALKNLLGAIRDGGTLIVSVPVETGFWGVAKYCAKTLVGYPMDEIKAGRSEYFLALLMGKDITRFRGEALGWATHYGFDWREVEERISTFMRIEKAYTRYATRFIVARSNGATPS